MGGKLGQGLQVARRVALAVLLLLAGAYFLSVVHEHYPLKRWLFWRYTTYWLAMGFWTFGCLSTGHLILRKLLRRTLRFQEQLLLSMLTGVLVSFVITYLAGLLHLFGPVFFYAMPGLMSLVGGWPFGRYVWRYWRRRRRLVGPPPSPLLVLVGLAGALGIGMVYFQLLSPENAGYDALWYHIPLGEKYWAAGGIDRSVEAWYPSTQPHLASVFYAWAFQIPGSVLFDQVELCLHFEFCLFLWSLVGINVLVARCVGRSRTPGAWAMRFAFPGVFLYGSTLNGGADHICSAFIPPVVLALFHVWRSVTVRWSALLALFVAGMALTKTMTTIMVAPAVIVAFLGRVAWCGLARYRKRPFGMASPNWWKAPLVAAGVGLAVTSPFWLTNWIWYGDPLFPVLAKAGLLKSPLWDERTADLFEIGFSSAFWRPPPGQEGWIDTAKALFTFSFEPHDWGKRHGKVPVFGSLFTLLTVALPFTKPRSWRGMAVGGIALVALTLWYRMNHQDRYLQGIMPLLVVPTAAAFIMVWREHLVARGAVVLVVLAQVIWGGDVYFIQTHAMSTAPLKKVNDLLESGYRKKYKDRLWPYLTRGMRKQIPKKSTVLLHRVFTSTGLGANFVVDSPRMQPVIRWEDARDPGEVWDRLRSYGVTHIYSDSTKSDAWLPLSGDLLFYGFLHQHGHQIGLSGGFRLTTPPSERPAGFKYDDQVAFFGCNDSYKDGLYRLSDLNVRVFRKPSVPKNEDRATYPKPSQTGVPADLVKRASFVVVQPKCAKQVLPALYADAFHRAAVRKTRGGEKYVRPEQKRPSEIWIRP